MTALHLDLELLDGLDLEQTGAAVRLGVFIGQHGIEAVPLDARGRLALLGAPAFADASHLLAIPVQRAAMIISVKVDAGGGGG